MTNPVLVEVTRGPVVESRHRGAVAILDAKGTVLASLGDIDGPSFPRSAVKPFQALPFVESGAVERFGFGDAEIAYSMSSHDGEERHVATTRAMLASAGLDETCLACGPHWPRHSADVARLNRMGAKPSRVHNNCSGKHAGFLCTCVTMGVDPAGYAEATHPLMREVIAAGEALTGVAHAADICGIDGCSIPTFAIPPRAMARGVARFVTGEGLPPLRARAAERIRLAAAADPFMVAGTGRFCTLAMTALGSRAMVKTGAEGVFTAGIASLGLGLAIKIDDGAARAAEVVTAHLLMRLLKITPDDPAYAAMAALERPEIRTWVGQPAGMLRPAAALAELALG